MNKKLFCTDLDDTLLCADKSVTAENIDALHELQEKGHYFAIVSGRSIAGSKMIFQTLGLNKKNCFLVSFQGNVIFDLEKDEIVSRHGMDPEVVIRLLSECKKRGIYAQTYTTESVMIQEMNDTARKILGVTREAYTMIDDYDSLRDKIMPKVLIISYEHPEILPPLQKEFKSIEEGKANSFFSCPQYLEYVGIGMDKGVGLNNLAKYLNMDIKDTIAVGDERNDLSMIKAAGLGCAMKNAHPDVKEVADYITTKDMNHSGVAEVVDKFVLRN
ncbi:MAG: Cof-type HAD-IIB family hydrolase [Lachnospiraceae bacterium]|nr:Cof-type HAD-IIB family hydrolase [Lachnospiraceae bacterium]